MLSVRHTRRAAPPGGHGLPRASPTVEGMHESGPRGTAPHDQRPGGPATGPRQDGSGWVRLATAGAGLSVLSSALVMGGIWSTAAGVLAAVTGTVLALVALVRSRGTTSRGVVTALAILAIAWGVLNAVGGGTRLVVWPASEAFQQCTENALTLSSTERCEQQLTDNVWHHFSGTPLQTGFPQDSASPTAGPNASPGADASADPSARTTSSATPGSDPTTASPSASASAAPSPTPTTSPTDR